MFGNNMLWRFFIVQNDNGMVCNAIADPILRKIETSFFLRLTRCFVRVLDKEQVFNNCRHRLKVWRESVEKEDSSIFYLADFFLEHKSIGKRGEGTCSAHRC